MPIVNVIHDPAKIAKIDQFNIAEGANLLDWLIIKYGADGFGVPTRVFKGAILAKNEIKEYDDLNASVDDDIFIVHSPLGADPLTIAYIAFSVIVAVAINELTPPIDTPVTNQREPRKSPNNSVAGQTNIARPLERVPDIFGEVIAYPDLILPTVQEYRSNIKYLTEYLCVSRGFVQIEEIKSGNTLISDIFGSTAEIYEPGQTPDEILLTDTSNEVKGLELPAPNDVFVDLLEDAAQLEYSNDPIPPSITLPTGAPFPGAAAIQSTALPGDSYEILAGGDLVYLIDCYAQDLNLDGEYTVYAVAPGNFGVILYAPTDNLPVTTVNTNWLAFDSNPAAVQSIFDGSPVFPKLSKTPDATGDIGAFVVSDDPVDQIWVDIEAPRGLAQGENLRGTVTVELEFFVEEIDALGVPTGFNFLYNETIIGNRPDPLFFTFKITPENSSLIAGRRYRITGRRLTDTDFVTTNYLDRIEWTRLAGIQNITAPDETQTTRLIIRTQATEQVANLQERKYNAKVTRKTVTWNGVNVVGDIDTGVGLTASRRFADAFLHYALDPRLGERNVNQIDVSALYAIQDELDAVFSGELGEFSYTFDGKRATAIGEMLQIVQAARCFLTREGSFISVVRDQPQTVARGLFNRRNKYEGEQRSIRFDKPQDNDGIQLEYIDRTDNNPRTITLPDDLPPGDPNEGLPATTNPKNISATGIANYQQAWNRAQYELNKLIYQRLNVRSSVTPEAVLLPLNAKILLSNSTKFSATGSNGEVLEVDGTTIKTSERCIFDPAETYSVIFRDQDGTPALAVSVDPIPGDEFGFILIDPAPFALWVRGFEGRQKGTLYNFDQDGNEETGEFLIQQKLPDSEGNVTLELINYAPEYYQADDQPAP